MKSVVERLVAQLVVEFEGAGRAAALARLDAMLDAHRDNVWVHRHLAEFCVHTLGDRQRAAAVLVAYEQRIPYLFPESHDWCVLAEAWREALADDEAVRRCIAAAEQRVEDVADHCSVAGAYAKLLGDRERAHARLVVAEDLIRQSSGDRRGDASRWWKVANAWHSALQDDARAGQCFDEGLRRATTTAECLTIACGIASHDATARDRIETCFDRGRALALKFDDWYAMADETRKLLHDDERVRDLLIRCEPFATTSTWRQQLARAYRDWLDDPATAATIGPTGVRPADWLGDPSAAQLFDYLRARIGEAELHAIARADYGIDSNDHYKALAGIVRDGLVPTPIPWHPIEVAELYRWRAGDDFDHTARALCCVLIVFQECCVEDLGLGSTWPVLLDSCAALGDDALDGAARLAGVVAQRTIHTVAEDRAVAALANYLARALRSSNVDHTVDDVVARQVLTAIEACTHDPPPESLRGDQRAALWASLFARVLLLGVATTPPAGIAALHDKLREFRPTAKS